MKCSWCNNEAVSMLEIRRGSTKRMPHLEPTCKYHESIIERQPVFYSCGCTYVEGEDKCRFHLRKRKNVRTIVTAL